MPSSLAVSPSSPSDSCVPGKSAIPSTVHAASTKKMLGISREVRVVAKIDLRVACATVT